MKDWFFKMKCKCLTKGIKSLRINEDNKQCSEFVALKKVLRDLIFYANKR